MKQTGRGWARGTEFLLMVAGTLCVGYCALVGVRSVEAGRAAAGFGQAAGQAAGSGTAGQAAGQGSAGGAIHVQEAPGTGKQAAVMGRLEIRTLKISVPIMADYQSASLLKGVGYIPGTAMPGGLGTLGLAGHRDTYLRPLKDIKKNMDIRVSGADGVYHYQVDSTEIVTPDQVEVLAIGDRPSLTLITCYPFYYVGSAPKRFIVHAHLVSMLPD